MRKIKLFFNNEQAQALTETIIFIFFAAIVLSLFLTHIGFIQVTRLRLAMANRFMVYSQAHDINPNAGRKLEDKIRLMLGNGPPIISEKSKNFKKLRFYKQTKSIRISGIDLPFGPVVAEGRINVDYQVRSSILQKALGRKTVRLSSGKMVQYKDILYSFLDLDFKKFLGYKEPVK